MYFDKISKRIHDFQGVSKVYDAGAPSVLGEVEASPRNVTKMRDYLMPINLL